MQTLGTFCTRAGLPEMLTYLSCSMLESEMMVLLTQRSDVWFSVSNMDLSSLLQDPQTNVDVAALFWGNLDEETIQNQHLLEFWLYLKFLPVLPYIQEQYLTQLSRRNFTCENFQMMYVEFECTD